MVELAVGFLIGSAATAIAHAATRQIERRAGRSGGEGGR